MFLRFPLRLFITILVLLVFGIFSKIQAAKIPVAAAPAWVNIIPVPLSTKVKPKEVSAGFHTLLRDSQFDLATQTTYHHQGFIVFSEDGLQEVSEIRVDFDPKFQKIFFHTVRIWRNGKLFNKTASARYKVIQRERELERHIYNEKLTAVIILEDVRIDDVLEYSFSIKGWNPVFKNKFCNIQYLQNSDPIDELFINIRSTPNRQLFIKSENTKEKAVAKMNGDKQEYTWHLKNIPAFSMDSDVPSWYDPYPCVYISEFQNWSEIVDWALPLFEVKEPVSVNLKEEASRIKKEHIKAEDRLAAATRFVQDKIRYLGMENGISGYKPFPPSQIMKQRFGDCKDKSLLLTTLLGQMDIVAYPALVNTSYQDQVKSWLPTFFAFNHCIVVAEIAGRQIWIDPTINLQRGRYDSISTPNYKEALVLKKGTRIFTKITVPQTSRIKIAESFKFKDIGGPVTMHVQTEYFGYEADKQRSMFATNTTKELEKSYLNFYANQYPGIDLEQELQFIDNEAENKFTTIEEYSINDFWTDEDGEEGNLIKANFYPQILRDRLVMPATIIRKMPIHLNHPLQLEQTINLYLTKDWPVKPETITIQNNSFFYKSNILYQPERNLITLAYSYKNLRDYVPVAEAKDYIKKQKAVLKDMGFQLTHNPDAPETEPAFPFNWMMLGLVIMVLLACSFGAYKLYHHYDPPQLTYDAVGKSIGGWLILIAIGLFLSPFQFLGGILTDTYYNLNVWQEITTSSGTGYNPLLAFTLAFEIIVNSVFLVYSALLIVLFIKRRTSLAKLIIIFYASNLAFILLDHALGIRLKAEEGWLNKSVFSGIFACLIWIPYFNVSLRVKETFVNRLKEPEPEELPQDFISEKQEPEAAIEY